MKIHTGSDTFVRPSTGAWISYGLGTENDNLLSFVTINPTLGHGGVRNSGSAFLPPIHQATRIATSRDNGQTNARIENLTNKQSTRDVQLLQLGLLRDHNGLCSHTLQSASPENAELNARIELVELAFRMQTEAPEIFELANETESTRRLYGIDEEKTINFGTQCLLARRMSEAGVRFV